MTYARIIGTGSHLPQKILTNADIEKMVDTSDSWIFERTGIKSRHIASPEDTVASMGAKAAQAALDMAGLQATDIDMILCGTCTPDTFFPSSACGIQHALNVSHIPAFDVQAACSGFIYGLSVADQFIKTGAHKRILVVGSEVMSRVVDWQDRTTCVLFGDGAGAVVLQADKQAGILGTQLRAKGSEHELLYLNNVQAQSGAAGSAHIMMQGNKLFRHAVNLLREVALETLSLHHLALEQLDWLVPHQANIRIIQATAEKLKLPMERVMVTLATQGNTSSASIPLALDRGIRDGRIRPGQTLLLEAIGGGLTWGTALIRY